MIPPVTTVLTRLFFSVWRLALLAALVASIAEFYSLEMGSS
jgi:hypothetical protein